MRTTSLVFLAAALCGAMVTYLLLSDRSDRDADRSSFARSVVGVLQDRVPPPRRTASDDRRSAASATGDSRTLAEILDAFVSQADVAPVDALREALALDNGAMRTSAVRQIARVWARQDPRLALAQAAALPAEVRTLFESVVATEWAFIDPAGFFAYAEVAASIDHLVQGLYVLIATDPERVWQIAGSHPQLGNEAVATLYLSAVRGMVNRDPRGAITRLEPLATGRQRGPMLNAIAIAYADMDIDAALAWAVSIEPSSADAVSAVLRAIASDDLIRAYDVTTQIETGVTLASASVTWPLVESALAGRQAPQALADTLVQRGDSALTGRLLESLISQWVIADPDEAIPWISTNLAHVDADAWPRLAQNIVSRDIGIVTQLTELVPPEVQGAWLERIALWYGQMDGEEALAWIAAYEGHPSYSDALTRVIGAAGITSPQFLVDFLDTSNAEVGRPAIQVAADFLTQASPENAIQWATELVDAERSAMAIEGVVSAWVNIDPVAVQRWALDQPRGESRDRILDAVMLEGALSVDMDREALLSAYASDAAAQQIIAASIERAARHPMRFRETSMQQFERMIERLTDPELRQQAELSVEAAGL